MASYGNLRGECELHLHKDVKWGDVEILIWSLRATH